jgi:small redox-active disulfide protein 2
MRIEVLGMGCSKCNTLYGNVRKAATELGIRPEIEHVRDLDKIADYGVMSTPALVIDGKVMSSGRIPSAEEIKGWLKK